jgi:sulfite oxidase
MTTLHLNSVVAYASRSHDGSLFVKGYATPGASGNVNAVEITTDGGETWCNAKITYQEGQWSWTLWEAEIGPVAESGKTQSRAIDSEGNKQPRQGVWNLRGVAFNGWGVASW